MLLQLIIFSNCFSCLDELEAVCIRRTVSCLILSKNYIDDLIRRFDCESYNFLAIYRKVVSTKYDQVRLNQSQPNIQNMVQISLVSYFD